MFADKASTRGRRPPLVSGARPLFGHLFEFKRNPEALLRRGAKEQGPLFVLKLGPMSIYCMVGPDMNTEFFAQSDKALSLRKAYRFLAEMFNPRIALVAPPADYEHQRALVAPMLSGKRMVSHFEAMVKESELWLSGLGPSGRFDVVTEFERLTMYIIARAMLGDTFRLQMTDEFHAIFKELELGVDLILPPKLPLPKFIRRTRARARLRRIVDPMVEARRVSPRGMHDDFFQELVELPDTDGKPMSTSMVTDIILWLIFSGLSATSSQFAMTLVQMLQHPAWLAKVRAVLPSDVTPETIRNFDPMNWAIKESERMATTSVALPRVADHDYAVNGYVIPGGAMVFLSPMAGHYLPEVFTEPDRYDPERFSPERGEDRRVKNALAGFGGGQHRCWGANFASTEMAVALTLLLQKYDLETQSVKPRMVYKQIPRPQRPVWVEYRLRPRALSYITKPGGA